MATATTELKVVVGIVQESQGSITKLVNNLGEILTSLKNLGNTSLQGVVNQFKSVADISQQATDHVKSLTAENLKTSAAPAKPEDTTSKLAGGMSLGGVGSKGVIEELDSIKDSLKSIGEESNKTKESLKNTGNDGKQELSELDKEAKTLHETFQELTHVVAEVFSSFRETAEVFVELKAVESLKEMAEVAVKAQGLADALKVIGENSGIAYEELKEVDEQVQKVGISADTSRQVLNKMIEAGLDTGKASALAAMAKDAAAAEGNIRPIGEVYQQLVQAIVVGRPEMLKHFGILADMTAETDKYAYSIGKTSRTLTEEERAQAALSIVLSHAKDIRGAANNSISSELANLPVLIDNMKDAIGKRLLPVFQVLADQTTLLVTHLTELFEEKDGANSLGVAFAEALKVILVPLRESLELIVKFRGPLFTLISLWAGWKTVMLGMRGITFLTEQLTEILKLTEELVEGTLKSTTAKEAEAKATGDVAKAELEATAGKEAEAKATRDLAKAEGELAVARGADAAGEVVEGAAGAKSAENAAKGTGALAKLKTAATELKATFTGLISTIGTFMAGFAAPEIAVFAAAMTALAGTMVLIFDQKASDWLYDFLAKYTVDKIPADVAKKLGIYQRATDKNRKESKEEGKENEAELEKKKQEKENTRRQADLTNTEKVLFPEVDNYKSVAAEYNTIFKAIEDPIKGAAVSTNDLAQGLKRVSESVKTPQQLQEFIKTVEKYRELAKEKGGDVSLGDKLVGVAKINVAEFERAATEKYVQQQKALNAAAGSALQERLQNELELLKISNQSQNDLDRVKYDAGLLSMDQYFADRRKRIEEENEKEIALQRRVIANAQAQVRYAETPEAAAEARNRVQQEQNKLTQLVGTPATKDHPAQIGSTQQKLQQLDSEKEIQLRELQQQVKELQTKALTIEQGEPGKVQEINTRYEETGRKLHDIPGAEEAIKVVRADEIKRLKEEDQLEVKNLEASTNDYFGGLPGKIQEINDKYDQMGIKLRGVNGAVQAIAQARGMEILKAQIEEANKTLKENVDLETSRINLAKQAIDTAVKNGVITEDDAMKAGNEIIRQRMGLLQQQIQFNEQRIAQEQKSKDSILQETQTQIEAQEKLKASLVTKGLSTEDVNKEIARLKAVAESTGEIDTRILQLKVDSNNLNAQLIALGDQIETYGKKIQKSFGDGLSQAFKDVFTHAKTAQDAFIGMAKSWGDQIASTFAKNISDRITQGITNATSKQRPVIDPVTHQQKIDPKTGKPLTEAVPGTSIFDLFGSFFGKPLVSQAPTGKEVDPIWVKIKGAANNAITGASGTGTSGGLSTAPIIDPEIAKEYARQHPEDLTQQNIPDTSNPGGDRPSLLKRDSIPEYLQNSGVEGEYARPNQVVDPITSLFEKLPEAPSYQEPTSKPDNTQKNTQSVKQQLGSALQSVFASYQGQQGKAPWVGSGGIGGFAAFGSLLSQYLTSKPQTKDYYDNNQGGDNNFYADGGVVNGPGTGKSDSIPAKLSNGEFVVTAEKTREHLPLLQAINNGYSEGGLVHHLSSYLNKSVSNIAGFAKGGFVGVKNFKESIAHFAEGGLVGMPFAVPAFADGGLIDYDKLQSIALAPLVQKSGSEDIRGTVVDQAAAVKTGGPSNMMVQLHPDSVKMTMQDFIERELARQFSRR